MKQRMDFQRAHLAAAALFLAVSAAALATAPAVPPSPKGAPGDSAAAEPIRSEPAEEAAVPPEVEEAAERFRAEEFDYVQAVYDRSGEYGYTESRLENVAFVYTCDAIEGETFEVYEMDYRYRALRDSAWLPPPGYPSVYLVFSPDPNGTRRQVCYFRDASFSPENNSSFIGALYESLMGADETLLWKLNAGTPLDAALERKLFEKMRRVLPSDIYSLEWKRLALQSGEEGGTAYGLLLFLGTSGSPMIYSTETGRYVPAIFSVCCLPAAISCQRSPADIYTVTGLWTPSEEQYEEDTRRVFPRDTAEDVLGNIGSYAAEFLESATDDDALRRRFSEGPVWPGYVFNEALDDDTLVGLVQYYGEYDIYTAPVREELARRFSCDPDSIRDALLRIGDENVQKSILRC